jgi:hypothetical protein
MKKVPAFLVCLLLVVAWVAADGPPLNFFYPPASIGLFLPDDTEWYEDEETEAYYFESESAELYVMVGELENYVLNSDVLNEKKFKGVLTELGASDIVMASSSPEGNLVFNSAKVTMTWDDGSKDKGYMLVVNSKDAKNRSFLIGIFAPKIIDDWDNPAFLAYYSVSYAKAPK